jgi:hypothetical protein
LTALDKCQRIFFFFFFFFFFLFFFFFFFRNRADPLVGVVALL